MLLSEHLPVRVFRSATVVDGTGSPRYVADVVVEGARIVEIATSFSGDIPAHGVEVDAKGLVLAPGFIDMHAHSDLAVLRGAEHTAKLLQGVTTEVLGQDGIGYAPVDDVAALAVTKQIAGWNGAIDGATMPWRTMAEYLDHISASTAGNVAVLVPQGNLRMLAMGYEPREATAAELDVMVGHLEAALDAGAVGMSSGLTYAPGMFATTAELEALCRVVADRGGYWAPHTRGYGGGALEAFGEALDIGRRTGCAIHLTHATMNFAPNRGRAAEFLALVDAAIADGVKVTIDTYPYLPGATTLAALVPSWVTSRNGGDIALTMRELTADDLVRLDAELAAGCDGFHGEPADWNAIQLSGVASDSLSGFVGRTIAGIAAAEGRAPLDVVVSLLATDGAAIGVLMHVGDEDNVRAIMQHPVHTGGSDGILIGAKPHPRGFGAFARYLGEYVRDLGVLTLEQAVQHLSATPAKTLRLDRGDAPRGTIRIGAIADLVLFDPETVAAGATFDAPRTDPIGVREVLVNGELVVSAGALTGATPGRVLRALPPAHRATVPTSAFTPTTGTRSLAGLVIEDGVLPEQMHAAASALLGAPGETRVRLSRDATFEPEQYSVVVGDDVHVYGGSDVGLFRGLMVLDQLRDPIARHSPVACGTYEGKPTHSWRGLLLDVARHFRPVEDVLRVIDLMARHGLSVLHLHLTDDQGWRYEVPAWPKLTTIGATRSETQRGHGPNATIEPGEHGGHYTLDDLRRIDDFAHARGITVVPEVEFPGHVQAAIAAYPELGNGDVATVTEPWPAFGFNPHTLNLEPQTVQFCRDAIDVLADTFRSAYIGIGGDEVSPAEWAASPRTMARAAELGLTDAHQIQPWLTVQLVEYVRSIGRIAYAWDEVLAGAVPDGTVIAAWRGQVAVDVALERGYPTVVCPDTELYLDYRQSESADDPVPIGPPLTNEGVWSVVLPVAALGGQANVWSEHLDTRDAVDFAMFPRLAVAAERFWRGGTPGEWAQFARVLETHELRLQTWGVRGRSALGPTPAQRKPGVPGVPRTRAEREAIVAELVRPLR